MIEIGASVIVIASTSLVAVTAAFARAEVKQRVMQRELGDKAEKDVVEAQLDGINSKLDLIITEVQLIQRR